MTRAFAIAAASFLVACGSAGSDGGTDGGTDASLADASVGDAPGCLFCSDVTEDLSDLVRVRNEIDRVCSAVDCHGSSTGGMGLSPGAEFDAMIDVPSTEVPSLVRVLPGDPAHSYVYVKLACDGGIPDGDACMPLGAVFDPELVRVFHDWIEAGAPTQ